MRRASAALSVRKRMGKEPRVACVARPRKGLGRSPQPLAARAGRVRCAAVYSIFWRRHVGGGDGCVARLAWAPSQQSRLGHGPGARGHSRLSEGDTRLDPRIPWQWTRV